MICNSNNYHFYLSLFSLFIRSIASYPVRSHVAPSMLSTPLSPSPSPSLSLSVSPSASPSSSSHLASKEDVSMCENTLSLDIPVSPTQRHTLSTGSLTSIASNIKNNVGMNIIAHNSRLINQSNAVTSSLIQENNEDRNKSKDNNKSEDNCENNVDLLNSLTVNNDTVLTAKVDEDIKDEETVQSDLSPLVISISQSPFWLPSELHRRLSLGPVPRLHAADAGTSSAILFTDKLLEDVSQTRTHTHNSKTNTTSDGFQGFLSVVVDLANLIE